MSYYGAGDYYGAGGIGSFFGRLVRGVGRAAIGQIPIVGPAASAVLHRPTGGPGPIAIPTFGGPTGGKRKGVAQTMPGQRKRYRRMNYMNPKALRRASRRTDGFVKEVKKSLKHTNYALVSKSSRSRARRPQTIRESGSGSVIVN